MENKTPPIVSIVIPCFNRINLIENTLKSVFNQSYKNFEVIVIDNKSTDGTWELLNKLSSIHNNLKIYQNNKNIGMYPNWNVGLNLVSGKYYKHLSSDNILDKNYLKRTVEILEANNSIDIVITSMGQIDINNNTLPPSRLYKTEGIYTSSYFIKKSRYFFDDFPGSPDNQLIRTELLRKNSILYRAELFPYSADMDFTLSCIINSSCGPYIIPEVLVYLRIHSNTNTKDNSLSEHRLSELINYRDIYFPKNYIYGISRFTTIIILKLLRSSGMKKAIEYRNKRNSLFPNVYFFHDIISLIIILKEACIKIIKKNTYIYFR